MTIAAGTQLGPYEVLSVIGAGGMGDVYKARDTRLERLVALKISKTEFDERFAREARAIAALNHPHICTLHDVGPNYLVMEYIDGTPLEGPLPLDQALRYATQIADALDAAHRHHIVHRDLKPANILLTKSGVKLLDFGLAKQTESADLTGLTGAQTAITLEAPLTAQGTILGTLQYMSPEQLQGRPGDSRSDIFALGLVLYEMLTGRRAFGSSNPASVIAAILERPAPVIEPERIHQSVNRVIATCLAKDPEDRFQSARDLKRAIEWSGTASEEEKPLAQRVSNTWIAWVAVAVCAMLAIVGWLRPREAGDPADHTLTIAPPSATGIVPVTSGLAGPRISPDGSVVAYFDRSRTLQLRWLNSTTSQPLRGLDGVQSVVWSPDSKFLLFSEGNTLKRVQVPDGAPETVGTLPAPFSLLIGVSESGASVYVCCQTRDTFSLLLAAKPGAAATAFALPGLKEGSYGYASFLPGGEDLLIDFVPNGSQENETYLVGLRNGTPVEPQLLVRNTAGLSYTPAAGGWILFVRNDNLYAQRLNLTARRLDGEARLLQQGVASRGRGATFSVSRSGVLVWRPGRQALAQVTIFDRQGKPAGTAGPPTDTGALKLSPDEQRVLLAERNGHAWLLETNQPGRLDLGQGDLSMLWSPSGSGFLVPRASRIVERAINGRGDGRALAHAPDIARLEDVSRDRGLVLFRGSANTPSLLVIRMNPQSDEGVTSTIQTGRLVSNAKFSPDSRWIAYQADGPAAEMGVYAQQFPGPALPKQITSSGESPVWGKDGKEILYLDQDRIWSVRVDTSGGQFRAGVPEPMFSVRSMEGGRRVRGISQLAVSRDGSRIYYQQPVEQPDSDVIHVTTGWERVARSAP